MIGNKDFIDDIKQYILNELSQDANFSDLNIVKAYDPQNVMKTPQVSIYIANDREDESSNSYDSENISSLRAIFYCYNKAMRFNDDEDKTDVVESTMILADTIKELFNKNKLVSNNINIISSTRRSYVQPQPIRDDGVYVAILTYDFKVLNDYTPKDNQNTNQNTNQNNNEEGENING